MKTIKELNVSVTYNVSLLGVEVPDDVYEQLLNNEEFSNDWIKNSEATDWLMDNINESDGLDFLYVVDEFEE